MAMAYEAYSCDLDPDTKAVLRMYLFRNVRNVDFIRNNVIAGAWDCAVIKARLVVDPLQVAVAANRAALARVHGTMVTKTINSEILYNLSLTKNITQSLTKFGVEKDSDLLFCFVEAGEGEAGARLLPQVEGEPRPPAELATCTSWKDIKAVYRLNSFASDADLLDVIVSRMVTKNFVSY